MAYVPLYRIKEGREKMSLPNMMLENITKRKKHELLFVQYFKMILQKFKSLFGRDNFCALR